jgi:Sulfotransferase domain
MKETLDFIVIGAQKTGTTSLFEYLRPHPELFLPSHKEAAYFSHDAEISRGWDRYLHDNFVMADPGQKWGTVTPSYMVGGVYDAAIGSEKDVCYSEQTQQIVPLRISQRLPRVRLIALLRDPIERARSHHKMMTMRGLERRSFDEAVDELLRPSSLANSRAYPRETSGYVTWGEYGRVLGGYFDVFPRKQILVLFTEDLEHVPEAVLVRIYEFLDVSSDILPDNLGTRYREGGTTRRFSRLDPNMLVGDVAQNLMMRKLWHLFPQASRRRISDSYAGIAYQVDLWNRRSQKKLDEPSPEILTRLREHFTSDADRLAELLDEVPPWHAGATTGVA